jgi:hypothetical protein
MPDALPDTTLPISRLGTGSTNGSNNGRGWGLIRSIYQLLFWYRDVIRVQTLTYTPMTLSHLSIYVMNLIV